MNPHVSISIETQILLDAEEEEEEESEEDFRQKQVYELEQLQRVIDENNNLRMKFNVLQTQVVAPTGFGQTEVNFPSVQIDKQISPEELDNMKKKLTETLSEYRKETQKAKKLNQEVEKQYKEIGEMKLYYRHQQDEKIAHQNQISSIGLNGFRAKTTRVMETWQIEKNRLMKAIKYLHELNAQCVADMKEFEQQTKTNLRGISNLSTSITIAKEDIKEFQEELRMQEPKLKEFEEIEEKHKQTEAMVVELSDQLEEVRSQVATKSLTAQVREQIDEGNQKIADLNRSIDQLQSKTAIIVERIKDHKNKMQSLEIRLDKTNRDTDTMLNIIDQLKADKVKLKQKLMECREETVEAGGENIILEKSLDDGVTLSSAPWTIRKQMIGFKNDLVELEYISEKQAEVEQVLHEEKPKAIEMPTRRRVPMIPIVKPK